MAQSLEELKELNRAEEEKESEQANNQVATDKIPKKLKTDEKPEAETEEDEDLSDDEDEDDESTEGEDWMQSDEQTSEEEDDEEEVEAKFTDGDVAAVRRKLKGKLQKERDEKEILAEENARLKAQLAGKSEGNQEQMAQAPAKNRMPRLADFAYNEDRHEEAMANWIQQNAVAASQRGSSENSQAEAQAKAAEKTEKAVDDHYLRVNELVKKSNIAPEVYTAADTSVRQIVESVVPNGGDVITDGIIARLGSGSEKVIFNLGRNKVKREQFHKLLVEDPSGIAAAMMLGELKTSLLGGKSRGSNAPKPSGQLNGDGGGSTSTSKLKRQYEKAGDVQTRFNLKREAKNKGIDVSGW